MHYSCNHSRIKLEGNLISCNFTFIICYSNRLRTNKINRTTFISILIAINRNLISI